MSHELAWAAGFFDGEGSVGSYGTGVPGSASLVACVVQKRLEPLHRFRAAVNFGKIYGPAVGGCYRWAIFSSGKVKELHVLLEPYLSLPKREQFLDAIATWENRKINWARHPITKRKVG